jgi:hypothetical protein
MKESEIKKMADGFMKKVLRGEDCAYKYFLKGHDICPDTLNNLIRKYDYLYEVMHEARAIVEKRLRKMLKKPPKPKKYKKGDTTVTVRVSKNRIKWHLDHGVWFQLDGMDRSKRENKKNVIAHTIDYKMIEHKTVRRMEVEGRKLVSECEVRRS